MKSIFQQQNSPTKVSNQSNDPTNGISNKRNSTRERVAVSNLCAIIPCYSGYYQFDIIPPTDVLSLSKNVPLQVTNSVRLIWKGSQDFIDFPKKFLYFESTSVKNQFPTHVSPKFKPRLDIVRKNKVLLVYTSKKYKQDFEKLKRFTRKGCKKNI